MRASPRPALRDRSVVARALVASCVSLAALATTGLARADEPAPGAPPSDVRPPLDAPAVPTAPPPVPIAETLIVATPATEATASKPNEPGAWYGWQLIIADVVGLGAMTGGGIALASQNSGVGAGFFYSGFGVSNFGGPIIHIFHSGEEMPFLASYGMRSGLPIAGLLVGFGIGSTQTCNSDHPTNPCITGMIFGTIGGALAAAIIDDATLAWERPPQPDPSPRARAVSFMPTVTPAKGGAVAGLTGAF